MAEDYSAEWAEYYRRQGAAAGDGPQDDAAHRAAWDAYYRRQQAAAAPTSGAPTTAAPSGWAAPAGTYAGTASSYAPTGSGHGASGGAAYGGSGYGGYPSYGGGGAAAAPSYNAVPPPASLDVSSGGGGRGRGRGPRPAYVAVPSRAAPAAAAPSTAPPAAAATGSASWPPSLRAYVERAFASFSAAQRPALAAALKAVIGDAQAKGEVWSRPWDTLPLPDLGGGGGGGGVHPPPQQLYQPPAPPPPAAGWHQYQPPAARRAPPSAAAQAAKELARRRAAALAAAAGSAPPPPPPLPGPPPGLDLPTAFGAAAPKKGKKAKKGATPTGKRKRASRWDDGGGGDDDGDEDPVEAARRARRAGRFGAGAADGAPPPRRGARAAASAYAGGTGVSGVVSRRAALEALLAEKGDGGLDDADWDALAVRGTATSLEKSYFRLTAPPDPATVRPEPVLRAALDRLVGALAARSVTYFYAADQFKGMRQDCTVQRLRGAVTAAVYEAHARAALEYGDAAEYNQCQAQLVGLHAGSDAPSPPDTVAEFLAYRILYQAAHARTSAGERLALLRTLASAQAWADAPAVKHALAARAALARGDAPAFFALYAAAPRLGRALMDVAAPGLRFDTLRVLVAAVKPALPVKVIARVLGFGPRALDAAAADATTTLPGCSAPRYDGACAPAADEEAAIAAATSWLRAHGAIVTPAAAVDCRASVDRLAVPEDDAAVAHGDARLAVDDFMKSF